MSQNRLGTFAAGLMGLGWLTAVCVNLFVWFPQAQDAPPGFYDDAALFLKFVRENSFSWRLFHIGATVGLMGLVLLVGLLADLDPDDSRRWGLTAVGLSGSLFALLATLIDFLGTPVLARFAAGNDLFVTQIWEFMEPWRDAGLKTVSFWFLGIWALWLGGRWLARFNFRLGRFSQVLGWGLLGLAFIETFIPPPLLYTLGETGLGGLIFLLFPIWGIGVARWFWRQELALSDLPGVQKAGNI